MTSPSQSDLPSQADIERVLAGFTDPETGASVLEGSQVRDLRVDGSRVSLVLALTTHSAVLWEETRRALVDRLKTSFPALGEVSVELAVLDRPPTPRGELAVTAKSIIAVGSGKGGVGKSTIAASIALGLARAGSKVGLLDADVYGPSIPHLLGASARPEVVQSRIQPIEAAGVKMISIGLLVPPGDAVVWRGPMLHHTLTQFLRDVAWGPLDYLVIDMPPGTGDVALSLSQLVPLSGAVVVCTPQEVALLDAVKAVAMFRKVNIPLLGMVENMSGFVCPDCGKRYDIFGSGGAKQRAAELGIPFLGEVPITISIRTHGDSGETAANFTDPASAPYLTAICQTLVRSLAQAGPTAAPLPSLKI
jgi:ATP-binding protein involved in chromosome partitioning